MQAYLIIDGQWGSCGKGLLAGKLALDRKPDAVFCNFGPNAGHTFIHDGKKIMTQQLPTGLVHREANLILGPGAIINPAILLSEIRKYEDEYEITRRLYIHENAAIVTPEDINRESEANRDIASTRKGVGSAIAKKVRRVDDGEPRVVSEMLDWFERHGIGVLTAGEYHFNMYHGGFGNLMQIESAQGLELSLNHGLLYPHCTSRDVTPEAILNDVGVPMRFLIETCAVIRTFPIRVGNEYDEDGQMVGYSGSMGYPMNELTWADVSAIAGQDLIERTTVTGKVRRVFEFSPDQFKRMLDVIGPGASLMINFLNYLPRGSSVRADFLMKVGAIMAESGVNVAWAGEGPAYEDVIDINSPSDFNRLLNVDDVEVI